MSSTCAWKVPNVHSRKAALSTKACPEGPLPPTTILGGWARQACAALQAASAIEAATCRRYRGTPGRPGTTAGARRLLAGADDADRLREDHPEVRERRRRHQGGIAQLPSVSRA